MRVIGRLALSVVAGSLFACSHQNAETARQVELMSERLLILQNDRDRLVERVEALEVNAATSRGVGTPQPSDARPPLKVVKLLPHPEVEEPSATLDLGDPTAAPDSKAGQSDRVVGETEQAQRPDSNSLTGPRVVLYGEGPASGVRAVAPGDEQ